MDIISLVKANIRHKKGAFFGIIIFMLVISLSVTSIVSLKRNFTDSISSAYDHTNGANISLNIRRDFLTSELLDDVNSHPYVERTETMDTLLADSYSLSNGTDGSFSLFISELTDNADRLWKADLSGFEDTVPPLTKGGIYLPQAMGTNENINIGDTVTASFGSREYSFTVKGFIEEPVCGSAFIPIKAAYVCAGDMAEMTDALRSDPISSLHLFSFVYIFKSADCELSDNRFASVINKETLIGSYASGIMTRTDSIHYQDLLPDIILNIFLSFVIILTVIVFVVMCSSISSGIDLNFTDLGILKAQGFNDFDLKCVFLLQYMLAEFIGTVFGIFLSLPVINNMPKVFEPIVGIKITGGIDIVKSLSVLAVILFLSAVFILLVSGRIGRISPVKAVNGGHGDIYFDSRLNVPVTGRMLSASLAFRQFTAGKKRYAASIAIASMLVFFLMTMTGMTDAATSENARSAMGGTNENLTVEFTVPEYTEEYTAPVWEQLEQTETIINEYTSIEERYRINDKYMLLDGEKLYCIITEDEDTLTIVKGRTPKYANEIAVGQVYAEDMGYKIGDKLEAAYRENKGEFVITGFCVGTKDTGRFFAMNGDAGRTLEENICPVWAGYSLADPDKAEEICERLKSELPAGCTVTVHSHTDSMDSKMISQAASAIRVVIYMISAIFAFAAVSMVCTRIFAHEKTDIGIYKALGFTSAGLRLQFALRFLIVALIGIVIGTAFSLTFSEKLLSYMLRSMGIANFVIDYRFATIFLPIAAAALGFFAFAFITASRIKKVEIRTLISE